MLCYIVWGRKIRSFVFESHEKKLSLHNDQSETGKPAVFVRYFNVAVFLDTRNEIGFVFCMMVVLIKLRPFVPPSVTLTFFLTPLKILCPSEETSVHCQS